MLGVVKKREEKANKTIKQSTYCSIHKGFSVVLRSSRTPFLMSMSEDFISIGSAITLEIQKDFKCSF